MQFLIDNIILIAVAFFSGAMLVWPAIRGRASGPSLSTLQATQLINTRNPQIVDLRSADDFAKGSLPNARNLPSDKLNDRIGDLKKDRPVLLVCATGTSAGYERLFKPSCSSTTSGNKGSTSCAMKPRAGLAEAGADLNR